MALKLTHTVGHGFRGLDLDGDPAGDYVDTVMALIFRAVLIRDAILRSFVRSAFCHYDLPRRVADNL